MKIKLTSVYVDNLDKALRFYTEKLGFVKKSDFSNGPYRWLTVASPEEPEGTELHLALNSGIPLVDPTGGFYFVFQTGDPVFRKYDREGRLLFERHMQGRELDSALANLPTTWPTRKTDEGELPLVQPTIRTKCRCIWL